MSNILKVSIAIVFLAAFLPGFVVAFEDGRSLQHYNESTTVNYTADYTVEATRLYQPTIYDNESVFDDTAGGPSLEDGTDYDFFPDNGTLRFYDTAATSSGDTAHIEYNATAPTQEQQYMTTSIVVVAIGSAFVVLMVAFSFTMEKAGIWGGE